MLSSTPQWIAGLLAAIALVFLTAAPLAAETVKLRSGRDLQVDEVRLKEKAISITIRQDGGTARVDLRFDRLDPRGLLDLLDRYTDTQDGAARLRAARIALEFGLHPEAAERFRQAAALDPALAGERDAGLDAIRKLDAADALAGLEKQLRSGGDPRVALTKAASMLEGPGAARFSPGQLLRITTLAGLAQRLVERDMQLDPTAGLVPEGAPPEPGPAQPGKAEPAPAKQLPTDALPAKVDERVRAELKKARHAREKAADPALTARRAVRYLETAARALLGARRALREVPAAFQAAADDAYGVVHELLVATYLDLADLYRQLGRFTQARAIVRSVLILDPGNEEAREQRLLIEDDLRQDPYESEVPYGTHFYRIGPYGYLPYYGYPRIGYFGTGHHGHGSFFGFRFGHHHVHRHVGRRR